MANTLTAPPASAATRGAVDDQLPPIASDGRVDAAPRASVARRFAERFALIALALYHVPLLLNNYPSLGGGGLNDTGPAVRWGHIFTVPGLWIARHVFHVGGPMLDGARGDNGDVAEEFARLLLAVVIGIVAAAAWTFADRRRPRGRWVPETLRVLLRYAIVLGLASYAIAKILPQQFPPLRGFTLEQRVGDLGPMSLLWTFMEYSRPYAVFGGLMECAVVALLCARRTATAGALLCLAVMTNVALLNYAYGVPVKLYSSMLVVSAAVLVAYDAPRLLAVFIRNQPVPADTTPAWLHEHIATGWRWAIKLFVVGSVVVSSVVAMWPSRHGGNDPSGLAGTWAITTFAASDSAGTSGAGASGWQRLLIDRGLVAIRTSSDSLIPCSRRQSADQRTLAMHCLGSREAALRWSRAADTLQLDGTFGALRVHATAQRLAAPYRLLSTRFRWFTD